MSESAYGSCEWRTETRGSLPDAQSLPLKDEGAKIGTDEDADDEVTVVVHGQQHDKARDSKLNHVYQRTDGLLEHAWAEGRHGDAGRASQLAAVDGLEARLGGIGWGSGLGCGGGGRGRFLELGGVLLDDEAVVLLGQAAEELEGHDEEDDADAGAGEHALGLDLPGLGDEAGVDDVPVPEHLVMGSAHVAFALAIAILIEVKGLTEIWHEPPMPIMSPMELFMALPVGLEPAAMVVPEGIFMMAALWF